MNLAEHHMYALVGLYYSSTPYMPRGASHYYSFTLITGNNGTLVAKAAACSYRLLPLNTLFN
jgi:hypothetical protein